MDSTITSPKMNNETLTGADTSCAQVFNNKQEGVERLSIVRKRKTSTRKVNMKSHGVH